MKRRILAVLVGMCLLGGQAAAAELPEPVETTERVALAEPFTQMEAERELRKMDEESAARYIVKLQPVQAMSSGEDGLQATASAVFQELKADKAERIAEIEEKITEEIAEPIAMQRAAARISAPDTVTLSDWREGYQLLTLPEAVDAEAFVSRVADGQYAYIQPDYQLELQAEEEPRKAEEPAQPVQPEDPALGAGATVAVIDSGIDVTHPMLADKLAGGWDFVQDAALIYDETVRDQYYHGTHVAGIIAQTAPGAQILPLKVFENGKAYTSDIIEAIAYAENAGATAVNCSFGSTDNNQALREAMAASDMLFVCAAGNNRMNVDETPIYPACFDLDNILSVTSLNEDNGFSYYSNYGTAGVDIAARGRDVESAYPGGETGVMSGTSMAAGFVTAAAAIAGDNARTKILDAADRLSNLGQKVANRRALNLDNLIAGIPGSARELSLADDFDVHGYQRTPAEDWELFCSLDTVQVAAGGDFSLALKADGTVWSWGGNENGQLGYKTSGNSASPRQISGIDSICMIDAKQKQAFAVKEDGTVYAWGDNSYGQLGDGTKTERWLPVQVVGLNDIIKISAGRIHTAALREDGTVYVWGNNNRAQLGTGDTEEHLTPFLLDLTEVSDISAGGSHTAIVKEDGTVYAWGDNSYGQLGDGTMKRRTTAVKTEDIADVGTLSTGLYHTMAIKKDGTVYAWGSNTSYQYGNGTQSSANKPVLISGLAGIKTISIGTDHTVAVSDSGIAYAWGDNTYGQLGDGTYILRKTPVQITDLSDVSMATAGGSHTIALTHWAAIYIWGSNTSLQLGIEKKTGFAITAPNGLTTPAEPVAGVYHSMALQADGTVMAWGYNSHGQLGDGTTTNRDYPSLVSRLTDIKAISAGYFHNLAVKENGMVYAWGHNGYGQLGAGTANVQYTPIQVANLTDVKTVAAGTYHSVALKNDGTVWTWGNNKNGELGNGTNTDCIWPTQVPGLTDIKDIAVGYYTNFAIKTDGSVMAWGANNEFQLGVTPYVSHNTPVAVDLPKPIKKISAGPYHTLALSEDGEVFAWGYNGHGQLGQGEDMHAMVMLEGLTDVQDISAGEHHSLALSADGSVWGWGYNKTYQVGTGIRDKLAPKQISGLKNITKISAGYGHNLALQTDGKIVSWGNNGSGQLGDGQTFQCNTPHYISGEPGGNTEGKDPSQAHRVQFNQTNEDIFTRLDEVEWFSALPKYAASYTFTKSENLTVELYKYNRGVNTLVNANLANGATVSMKYPEQYYLKCYMTDQTQKPGAYWFAFHQSGAQTNGRGFEVSIGGSSYYANYADGGKLYKGGARLTDTPVSWLCAAGGNLYYNTGGGVCKYDTSAGTHTAFGSKFHAYFMVSDGSYLYFANWSDGGRLYRCSLTGSGLTCICKDIGAYLELDGSYLYYQNSLDGGKIYRVSKTASNRTRGELVR